VISNISLSVMAWASALRSTFAQAVKEDSGQGILEYVVLVGFIGIIAYVAFAAAGIKFAVGDFANALGACLQFNDTDCKVPGT
jgi:hypothetical protein